MGGQQRIRTLHPGIVKPLSEASAGALKKSVLFWRNAGYENGADLAIQSFRKLAPRFPHIRFVFAVRPHDRYEQDLLQLSREFSNIDVHLYPYANGITLSRLLDEALFVIQPFRRLSINPQMSILETLYAGVPVIATEIESNHEVVQDGQTGLLIAPNDELSLSAAIERLLSDASLLGRLARNARPLTEAKWNWRSFGRQLAEVYDELP
jgi:glycosyltransferase involved in cell wall biosynthesis